MPPQLDQEIYTQLDQASNTLNELIFAMLQSERGVHLETAIAAASALAGTLLLQNTGVNLSELDPGSSVFVDTVNELGVEVVAFMQAVCKPLSLEPFSGWDQPIPEGISFTQEPPDLVRNLQPEFQAAMQTFDLDTEWYPYAASFSAMKIIKMGEQSLNPEISKSIAINTLVAASKTVPLN